MLKKEVFAGIFSVSGEAGKTPEEYVPALISNGEISLCVDYTGMVTPDMKFHWWPDVSAASVWWQGRRMSAPVADLFPFGAFMAKIKIDGKDAPEPARWTQWLDMRRAATVCRSEYAGLTVEGELFVPKGHRAIVIRRKFTAEKPVKVEYAETYGMIRQERIILRREDGRLAGTTFGKNVTMFNVFPQATGGKFEFPGSKAATMKESFSLAAGETKTIDMFYSYSDNRFERKGWRERGEKEAAELKAKGFAGLKAEHEADWAKFWEACEIRTPEPALNRFAVGAQYMLRSNVSHWGYPVGINKACWSGRYFAFDEMFQAQAMAATGHFAESVKCAEYRHRVLPHALRRSAHYGQPGKYGAWLFWEMDEDGDCEGCPPGFWEMHIFNHSTVSRSVWEHYNYTGDLEYLRNLAYPILLNMSRYFMNFWVYDAPNGGKYIGKATDLERLGPARDRPFLTTCGAIDTMRMTVKAAKLLGVEDAETAKMAETAELLVDSLPKKDGAYTVDTEAAQASVALLGGLFPFPVLPVEDEAQKKAAQVILADVMKYGNMYPMGKKVCPWYAGFISAAVSRLGHAQKAVDVLMDAASMQGPMGEMWEINEPGIRKQPNFATASGNCLYALTRLFVAEFGGRVELCRGVPATWKDYSFRLPVGGGAELDMEVKGGKLVRFGVKDGAKTPVLLLPAKLAEGFEFGGGANVAAADGGMLEIRFK